MIIELLVVKLLLLLVVWELIERIGFGRRLVVKLVEIVLTKILAVERRRKVGSVVRSMKKVGSVGSAI